MLRRNGFEHERDTDHEIWVLRDANGVWQARTMVSFGNKEIKSERLFHTILRQSKKTRDEFYRVLRGR